MKTTKPLLLALAALSILASQPHAKADQATDQSIAASAPSTAIGGTDSAEPSKDAKIAALESRLAKLEAMVEAYHAKIAALEKQIYSGSRATLRKGQGSTAGK